MSLFSKQIDKRIAAYQRELIETHYREVDNMYRQIRGWRHDYRNHIQTMKVLAANHPMSKGSTVPSDRRTSVFVTRWMYLRFRIMARPTRQKRSSSSFSKSPSVRLTV